MKKILVLTTLSQSDLKMTTSILGLAINLGADLTLLATYENDMSSNPYYPNRYLEYASELKRKLKLESERIETLLKATATNRRHPAIESLVRDEELGEAVWRITLDDSFLMVVMGGKKTKYNDSSLCSEMLSVTSRSNVPVLVIGKDQLVAFE